MKKNALFQQLYLNGILPVVVLKEARHAVPLANALMKGGIRACEITYRTEAAGDAITEIKAGCPDMLVGAGSVVNLEQAKNAILAGAQFIVSPGFDPEVVGWCTEQGYPIVPGTATPSEVQDAVGMGLEVVKLFPAESLGSTKQIDTLAGVFRGVKFMPTGGIGPGNLCSYLNHPKVLCCGGSWMCPESLIAEERFDDIEALARQAVLKMHDFFLLHIGLNSRDEQQAGEFAKDFAAMFELPVIDLPAAYFAGTLMEIVKKPFLGEHGHIAISTNNIHRAIAYFESRGYTFREETQKEDPELVAAYFTQEVGGFAVHLRRRLES